MNRLLSPTLLLLVLLALQVTGCEQTRPTISRDFEGDPLKAIPSGADALLQFNVRKALNQPLTKGLLDQYLIDNEEDNIDFVKIQSRFGIDLLQELNTVHLAYYDTDEPELENRNWACLLLGHFTQASIDAAILSNSLTINEMQYNSMPYKEVEMRGKTFYYMVISSRELIFTSTSPLLCRMIEISIGGSDYIENDTTLSPLLKEISEERMFWGVGELVDWEKEWALEGLMGLGEEVFHYPLEAAQEGFVQLKVAEDVALELTLIMDEAGSAQNLAAGVQSRRQELKNALNLLDQLMGAGQLERLGRFLDTVQFGDEAERFQLEFTMPTDEFDQTLTIIKAMFTQLQAQGGQGF